MGTHQVLTVHETQLVIDKSQGHMDHRAELQELGRDGEEPVLEAGQGHAAQPDSAALSLGTGAAGTWDGSPRLRPHGAAESAPALHLPLGSLPFTG